jgi:DUF2911 family protein
MRGRKIFGEVVPYEEVWSAGNDEGTTLVVSEHVHLAPLDGGIDIPAGRYTLCVIPRKDKPWTLIISKKPANGVLLIRASSTTWGAEKWALTWCRRRSRTSPSAAIRPDPSS